MADTRYWSADSLRYAPETYIIARRHNGEEAVFRSNEEAEAWLRDKAEMLSYGSYYKTIYQRQPQPPKQSPEELKALAEFDEWDQQED
jgi:hypothetical protein